MPKTLINGINLNYEQDGEGPQIVLIHGLLGSLVDWKARIVPGLVDQFTVLTLDLRGHGESDMPDSGYTSADMADDLLGLLDNLAIERLHLVGHSFGGVVALSFAVDHSDRLLGLTISDSLVRSLQPIQKVKDWVYWPLWKEQLKKNDITLDEESDLDFDLLGALRPAAPTPWKEGPRWKQWEKLLATTSAKSDLKDPAQISAETLARIVTPTQAIYGQFSFCLPTLDGLRKYLPNIKTVTLPNVGHRFPIMQPALFLEQVKSFHATPVRTAADGDLIEQAPPSGDTSSFE